MKLRVLLLPIFLLLMACTPADPGGLAARPTVDYVALKAQIVAERDALVKAYAAADAAEQSRLIARARGLILKHLRDDLIPQWYGTEWDFNGITQTPRKGMIACGYFVTTLLRDAGFKVERSRMAQQASLYIIRSLSPKTHQKRWSHISTTEFSKRMEALPEGLYVIGLDIHTGFISHDAEGVWFLHSSYGNPAVVVKELARESAVLAQSNLFVVGRVDNDWLLKKWLKAEKISTVTG